MKIINKHFIDGDLVDSHGKETMNIVNPSNQEVLGTLTLGDVEDTKRAIEAANRAFKTYSKSTIEERAEILQRFHDAIIARTEDHINALVEEYGGPRTNGGFLVQASAMYILSAKESLKNIEFKKTIGAADVVQQPIGVAGFITPWNANIIYICNKTASALAAGCTVVIKPSELSALQTQVIIECLASAKLPKGLVNIVNGKGDVVGAEITSNPGIAKISFTGSTVVGKTIARNAAETMKRVTLELGGKSAHIVLEDADLEKAIGFTLMTGFMNNGQACIAGTRLLVPETRIDEFKTILKKAVENIKVGSPSDNGTFIGPLISKTQYERVQSYIKKGIDEGAEVLVGGLGHPEGLEKGNFVKPTVFVNVNNNMTIAREEIFGPVLAIITYKNLEEAIAIANDTNYGLAGYVSGTNAKLAREVADRIEAGVVSINEFSAGPGTPFGGLKQSGIGRENGIYGIQAFLEYKTVAGK